MYQDIEKSTLLFDAPAFALGNQARRLQFAGRHVALIGIILPLLLIGGMKFTQVEIEALQPLVVSGSEA